MAHPSPPSSQPQPSGHDALAALYRDYAKSLPRRVRRIGDALRASRRAPGDARSLEKARTLAHRLRGTAGSYGFEAVSAAAGRVEDAIRRAAGAPGGEHNTAWSEVWAALREAEARSAEVGK